MTDAVTGEMQAVPATRRRGAFQGLAAGVLIVAAWLAPPTIIGLIWIAFGAPAGVWDTVVDLCLYWGVLGLAVVPAVAALYAARRHNRGMPVLVAIGVSLLIYVPASYLAMALIVVAGDAIGVWPGPGGD
jgi:hypothetical protein